MKTIKILIAFIIVSISLHYPIAKDGDRENNTPESRDVKEVFLASNLLVESVM